jgi:hypothetical protein
MQKEDTSAHCCPPFDPDPWDQKEFTWKDKLFVKDRVSSIFHIPINFGAVMKRATEKIKAVDGLKENMIVLADENSLWGADVYIDVDREIPGAEMQTLSGTFLSKVFEGPYKNMRNWIRDMQAYVSEQGKTPKKMYFYYTTCPKCAKKYGKNYVVLLAQI